jgi:hypothetical protein
MSKKVTLALICGDGRHPTDGELIDVRTLKTFEAPLEETRGTINKAASLLSALFPFLTVSVWVREVDLATESLGLEHLQNYRSGAPVDRELAA